MRDILFRGKRVDNGKWVIGSLLSWPDGDREICVFNADTGVMDKYTVEAETVGQYANEKDKSGKKIFDGDIVSAHGYFVHISMDTDYYEIHWNHSFERSLHVWADTVEIIGNIHDNPELLT